MSIPPLPSFDVGQLTAKILVEVLKPENAGKAGKVLQNATEESLKTLVAAFLNMAGPVALAIGRGLIEGENEAQGVFDDLAALGIEDLLGVSVGGGGFARRGGGGRRKSVGNAVGAAILQKVAGNQTQLAPSTAQAEEFLGTMASFAIEGWLEGWVVEFLSSLIPGVGNIETFGELDDIMANVMGFGRLSRRVLSPLIDATTVTPMEWHVKKTYRPTLLSAGEVARQVARGRWERDRGIEELARQGYSDERIEAIFNGQRKFFSAADVRTFVNREHWTRDQGIAHLRDQGYEEQAALDALRLEGLRRIDQLEDALASSIIAAYADRRISRTEFTGLLNAAVSVPSERALLTELADTRRQLNVRRLSSSQVEAMVKSGVAAMADYREALRREGYPENDILLLELQLQYERDRDTNIEAARAAALQERELERQQRAAAAEARRLELEEQRRLEQRGPIAKLEQAAIRGLIPLSRVEEVLAAEYDAETVGILLELVEDRRAEYVAQQERADRVSSGAAARGLNVGELRAAVFAQILTVDEFRRRLLQLGLSAEDAGILAATAAADLDARLEAERRRDEASDVARRRRIDLPRFEALVRRGARTVAQYDALLDELAFDDVDRAAIVDLLELKIADDAAARAERERAAAALAQRGLSLDQFERAVVLGVKTIDQYAAFLLEQGFATDAQIALVALLRERVNEANAARARRLASEAGSGGLALPIATIRRAARLGVIAPDVYTARLLEDGYDADDVAIDLELLLLEIADVQAARAKRDAAELDAAPRGLSLADVEQAVKRGLASIETYRARAAELGYRGDDLELLVSLLADELAELEAARARRATIDGELRARNLSVGQLEEAVKKGLSTLLAFRDELLGLGYSLADAELLTALLELDLGAAGAATEE